jgi:hypothetical protein
VRAVRGVSRESEEARGGIVRDQANDDDTARRESEQERHRSQRGPVFDEHGVQQRWSVYTDVEAEAWRREMAK